MTSKQNLLKPIFSLLLLFFFMVGCKPTSAIITSKDEAVKRGIYKAPANIKIAAKNNAEPKSVAAKIEPKKATITGNRINDKNDDDLVINVDDSSYLVKQLINAASEQLGAHYKSGGTTPDGFDCSGLMYSTFKKFRHHFAQIVRGYGQNRQKIE